MKTYRLYSLKILTKENSAQVERKIAIEDGLIINMETQDRKWLIDAIVENEDKKTFDDYASDSFEVEVVITSNQNLPAKMQVNIRNITKLSNKTGVLLEGTMITKKR